MEILFDFSTGDRKLSNDRECVFTKLEKFTDGITVTWTLFLLGIHVKPLIHQQIKKLQVLMQHFIHSNESHFPLEGNKHTLGPVSGGL